MSENRLTFEQLLERVAQGSEEAAWQIVEQYSPNILRAVRQTMPDVIRPKLDSIDIVQSVWASLLLRSDGISDLDTPERFVAYLISMAKRKVLATYRHYTRVASRSVYREQQLTDADSSLDGIQPGLAVSRDGTASAVASVREAWARTMKGCSPQETDIVKLRLSGLSDSQIAGQLNISERTVRRVLEKLASVIQK